VAYDLLIQNIKGLVQVRDHCVEPVRGSAMSMLPILENAFLLIDKGLIVDYGPMSMLNVTASEIIDASGKFVFPSFVDSHTHLVFAASREEEFVMKIKGATYLQIAEKGGGILNSARKVQQASEDELLEKTLLRAKEIIQTGTGAVEIKSGYGLTVPDELKMLRVARRVGSATPLTVKTTLLGAHAIPHGTDKGNYVNTVIEEMIPACAEENLADYVDVFCEQGFFSMEDTERIIDAGARYGLKARIHANQLSRSGGVQVGVKMKVESVDHLENIGAEEIDLLKQSSVMPTVLPGAAFFLGLPFPPARRMIEAGLPIAIASDFNPGSSPSGNMQLMMALASIKMKLLPEEAINAATINTAYSLELLATHGTISRGKKANVFITKEMPSIAYFNYAYGTPLVDAVILEGKVFGS
jgi:imidazolonepropionase